MIIVDGSANRSFIFPANLPTTFAYYTDLHRILPYLPHIYIARTYSANQFRVCYNTVELGVYKVKIFCDVQANLDAEGRVLKIVPLKGTPLVMARAGVRATIAQGYFVSESLFSEDRDRTRVDYRLELRAELSTPFGLRFVPNAVINSIAGSITNRRIKEIANGFIERSIDVFPDWLEELGQNNLSN